MDDHREYIAPKGTIWVCGACGKSGIDRTEIGDEACFLNAVLCYNTGMLPHRAVAGLPKWPTVAQLARVKEVMDSLSQRKINALYNSSSDSDNKDTREG